MSHLFLTVLICFSICGSLLQESLGQTLVKQSDQGFTLYRNGNPYYVRGVGGETNLGYAAAIGANSIRTWGAENAGKILDDAGEHGLSVMLGIWLIPERHGFNYNDKVKVEQQIAEAKAVVDKYKNHPSLLLWGIGNELDLMYTNTEVWKTVEAIADYIHRVDPNHPVATVTAGIDSMKMRNLIQMVPSLDILCINTYGDIANIPKNIGRYGWTGPYMITEWGPDGFWESPKTSWQVSIEQSSSEKRRIYMERYLNYIDAYKDKCLGSYAFFWGNKQEYTETWFGLFTKDGLPTEPVDALELLFTGKEPVKPSPAIRECKIDGKGSKDNIHLVAGKKYDARVWPGDGGPAGIPADDPQLDIEFQWKILAESSDKKSGGDKEKEAPEITGRFTENSGSRIEFNAPEEPGPYRLFVRLLLNGKAAYANIPFYVVRD